MPKAAVKTKSKNKKNLPLVVATSHYLKEQLTRELTDIANHNNGLLDPHDVVEAARSPKSHLHDHFEWDDTLAAEGFRIVQARGLIQKIKLTVLREEGGDRRVNVHVVREHQSLHQDRKTGGGYRQIGTILSDKELAQQLLDEALEDLRALQKKYAALKELKDVWKAVSKLL